MGSKADKVGTAVSSFQSHKGCVMHSNYCGLSLAIFPMRKPHAEEDTSKVMCLRLEASVGKALSVLSEDFCLHLQGWHKCRKYVEAAVIIVPVCRVMRPSEQDGELDW